MLLVSHRTPRTEAGCEELALAGASVFELDVQLHGDRMVVSHFLPVFRLPGWLENDNFSVRWTSKAHRDPTVQDVARLVPARCVVLLDLKEHDPQRRSLLNKRIAAELTDTTRFRICTREQADLDELRTHGFRTWRTIGNRRDLDRVVSAGDLPDEAVSVRKSLLDAATIQRLHGVVPTVVAWTVNSVEKARKLTELGVDGLTTDNVDVMTRASA